MFLNEGEIGVMTNLLQFLEEAFQPFARFSDKFKSVEEFIGNNDKCLDLIYGLLNLSRDDKTMLNKNNFNRASHIIITFLLGIGIEKQEKIISGVNVFNSLSDKDLWMYTSLLHDYGYFRNELLISKPYEDLELEYDLLTDTYSDAAIECLNDYSIRFPEYCTFKYQTIRDYYAYKREYISTYGIDENGEANDHGIIGACLAFSQYIQHYVKFEYPRIMRNGTDRDNWLITEPLLYKTACLVAAQHNLFKSGSKESDSKYIEYNLTSLLSTAPVQINENNALLLMLSIVDTIECSKRFSKKTNPKKYLQTMTILKNIDIEVNVDFILVDFTNLSNFILKRKKDNNELINQLESHIINITHLNQWTSYHGEKRSDYEVIIRKKNNTID